MRGVLAIDASLRAPSCATALGDDWFVESAPSKPVESLAHLATRAVMRAGIDFSDLDEIVVALGPGSFMGVRCAVATANALGFAAQIPITGFLGTDVVAVSASSETFFPGGRDPFFVRIPAGRGRVFIGEYRTDVASGRVARVALPRLITDEESAGLAPSRTFDAIAAAGDANTDRNSGGNARLSAHSLLHALINYRDLAYAQRQQAVYPELPTPVAVTNNHG